MTVTVNGKTIKLNGAVKVKILGDNLSYMDKFIDIKIENNTVSYTCHNSKTNENLLKEYPEIENITEYDNAIYIYAHSYYNSNKYQLVFYKEIA